jgi:hypothetical protein
MAARFRADANRKTEADDRMSATPEDWDARVEGWAAKLPERPKAAVAWLREPRRRWLRIVAAVLFILGGIFSILPILGLWMLPVGLALLSQDLPFLKVPLEHAARWVERAWARIRARRR